MHPHISKGRGSGWDESTGNTACLVAWGARRLCRRRTIARGRAKRAGRGWRVGGRRVWEPFQGSQVERRLLHDEDVGYGRSSHVGADLEPRVRRLVVG
jgi:hypothetical protein